MSARPVSLPGRDGQALSSQATPQLPTFRLVPVARERAGTVVVRGLPMTFYCPNCFEQVQRLPQDFGTAAGCPKCGRHVAAPVSQSDDKLNVNRPTLAAVEIAQASTAHVKSDCSPG